MTNLPPHAGFKKFDLKIFRKSERSKKNILKKKAFLSSGFVKYELSDRGKMTN